MCMRKQAGIFMLLLLVVLTLPAQDLDKINQWKKELGSTQLADTSRINLYIDIAKEYRTADKDSALKYANKGVKLALEKNLVAFYANALYFKATVYYFSGDLKNARNVQLLSVSQAKKINDIELLSRNYNLLGAIEFNQGNYEASRKYYDQKLAISQKIKDTSAIIETYYNISLICSQLGDLKNAINWQYKSLRLSEMIKDSSDIVYCSQGLAESYYRIEDFSSSHYYLKKAKRIAQANKDKYAQAGLLIDEGNIYQAQKQWETSIKMYDEAIAIAILSEDKFHEAIAVNNKAVSRTAQKKYSDAIMLFKQSEKISLSLNNQHGLLENYVGLSQAYLLTGQWENAYETAKKTKQLANVLKAADEMMDITKVLSEIFEKKGQYDSAYYYFRQHILIKDTLNSSSLLREISKQELSYEKGKMQQAQLYERKISTARFEKQQQIRNIFIISSIIILAALVLLFRNFRQKQKANREIVEQKKIIEHKNKDILDSINYSKRIQHAILTPVDEVKKLLPQSFVLFRPKDIVSGDFYFIEPMQAQDGTQLIALAMADCTGHGVPGAFMSIMAYNFLRQSLKEKSVNSAGQALDYVNNELISFLRLNQGKDNLRDGMDIAFCAIFNNNTISFAGANNPLWIVSKHNQLLFENGQPITCIGQQNNFYLYEIQATKQHVGYNEHTRPFESHTTRLQKNDMAILFTDGYADQFGGPNGKKIKSKKMAELILTHAHLSAEELGEILNRFFDEWKGEMEQVDDVSIIAYRV